MRYFHPISLLALAAAISFAAPISGVSLLKADFVHAEKGGGGSGGGGSGGGGSGGGSSGGEGGGAEDALILLSKKSHSLARWKSLF